MALKMATGHTSFSLVYGLEVVVPLEYAVLTLRTSVDERMSEAQSKSEILYGLLQLEEV